MKTTKKKGVGACSLPCNTFGVKGACYNFGMGIKMNDKCVNYSYEFA